MIVELDPVFRSGLLNCLNRFPDLHVVVDVDSVTDAWRTLSDRDMNLDPFNVLLAGTGLTFVQQVKTQFPTLPILLIERLTDAELLVAFQSGIDGYCPKGGSIAEFVAAIRQVAAGQSYWRPEILQQLTLASTQPEAISVLAVVRQNWRLSGLRQIDAALDQINRELRSTPLSVLDKVFLTGRRRELKAARWLVQQVLPPQDIRSVRPSTQSIPTPEFSSATTAIVASSQAEIVSEEPRPAELQAVIFDRIASKLQSNLENFTNTPLEIDILKQEKKRELFYTILRQIENVLEELKYSQVLPDQLEAKRSDVLRDLWEAVVTEFFGRYSTVRLRQREIEIVPVMLDEGYLVQTDILDRIPLVEDILSHILFQRPLTIDQTLYESGSPEALNRAIDILENLTIQLANAVVQPLLNRFANLEVVKQRFYDRRLLSTREIERFRNDLSWRFRVERVFREPKAIFESQYRLFVFSDYGIQRITIYSPRTEELEDLSGLQLAVTLALETRDAISPRLKGAIAFLGSGVVYVLTEVIGRGIGLIGRGILKGIGKSVKG
jgi:DNA-binding NarL/FixJ family response regulator